MRGYGEGGECRLWMGVSGLDGVKEKSAGGGRGILWVVVGGDVRNRVQGSGGK